jgi:hypothetical protein
MIVPQRRAWRNVLLPDKKTFWTERRVMAKTRESYGRSAPGFSNIERIQLGYGKVKTEVADTPSLFCSETEALPLKLP